MSRLERDPGHVRDHREHRVLADDEGQLDELGRLVAAGQALPERVVDLLADVELVGGEQEIAVRSAPARGIGSRGDARDLRRRRAPRPPAYLTWWPHSKSLWLFQEARSASSSESRRESTPCCAIAVAKPRKGFMSAG